MISTYFGTKHKLSQVWDQAGFRMPITVINYTPLTITQIKTKKQDGYQAIQVGFGSKNWKKINQTLKGHIKKSFKSDTKGAHKKEKRAPSFLREIKVKDVEGYQLGDQIKASQVFSPGDKINATANSKGRGFTGVMKRWGFHGGPRTHGQSDRQRAPGSIGQGTDPGRVHKGKKMPGRFGNTQVTASNLTIVKVDEKNQQIWVKGQVPGPIQSIVLLKKVGQDKKFTGLFDPSKKVDTKAEKPTQKSKTNQ